MGKVRTNAMSRRISEVETVLNAPAAAHIGQFHGFTSGLPSALLTIPKIPRRPYLPFLRRSVMHQIRLDRCISCA